MQNPIFSSGNIISLLSSIYLVWIFVYVKRASTSTRMWKAAQPSLNKREIDYDYRFYIIALETFYTISCVFDWLQSVASIINGKFREPIRYWKVPNCIIKSKVQSIENFNPIWCTIKINRFYINLVGFILTFLYIISRTIDN
jgi:hypothetical protein